MGISTDLMDPPLPPPGKEAVYSPLTNTWGTRDIPGANKTYSVPEVPPVSYELHDLLEKKTSAERKEYPVKSGFFDYFRDAIFRAAKVSFDGNKKHNPG